MIETLSNYWPLAGVAVLVAAPLLKIRHDRRAEVVERAEAKI